MKKAEESAFSNKAKIVNLNIPQKVKSFIEKNLEKEINYFTKKYKLLFNLIADNNLIIPEYKINLLNKNKKVIKKIENIEKLLTKQDYNRNKFNNYKYKKNFNKRNKFKKKFKYYSKLKKDNFENKKSVNY